MHTWIWCQFTIDYCANAHLFRLLKINKTIESCLRGKKKVEGLDIIFPTYMLIFNFARHTSDWQNSCKDYRILYFKVKTAKCTTMMMMFYHRATRACFFNVIGENACFQHVCRSTLTKFNYKKLFLECRGELLNCSISYDTTQRDKVWVWQTNDRLPCYVLNLNFSSFF